MNSITVAIVQRGPEYFDLDKSLDRAQKVLAEAGEANCQLVVFGESWLSGYPVWLDCYRNVAIWDHPQVKQVYAMMMESSIHVPSRATNLFSDMASKYGYAVVLGCNEVAGSTIYNSVLIFDEKGELANHHRKLMPTYTEKMVYGLGDGQGLRSVDTSFGPLTACICWEHFMPLTRQALHDSGESIHVALWPRVHEMLQIASRNYAFEGRCFTIAAGQMVHREHMPSQLDELVSDREWLLNGGSAIYAPDGTTVLEPQYDRDEVIYHTISDLQMIKRESMTLDVSGHYSRSDVFNLQINRDRTTRNA